MKTSIMGANQGYDSVWNYGLESETLVFLNVVECIMLERPTVLSAQSEFSQNPPMPPVSLFTILRIASP